MSASKDDTATATEDVEFDSNLTPESIVEALLFSTNEAVPAARITKILGIGTTGDIKTYVTGLNERYEANGASFRIELTARGYLMQTLPAFHPWVSKLHKTRGESRLTPAALETLAIVAYKQPSLRADIETVRGVAVGDMLLRLRELNLVRIVGRAEEIGRPLLYGTTNRFLEVFGLRSVKDLPKLDPDRPNEVPPLKMADEDEAGRESEPESSDST